MNNSLIAFNKNKIYTSLEEPDLSPTDSKLKALIELADALGEFGYIIDSEALQYLSNSDITEFHTTVLPILSEVYKHSEYKKSEFKINLEEWKKHHSGYNNFYGSKDLRIIYQSAQDLNLGLTYLDRMTSNDLKDILLEIIKKPEDPTSEERNEFTYLIQKYKVSSRSGNKLTNLLFKIYDSSYKFKSLGDFLDYSTIKLSRSERRLLMSKLEDRLLKGTDDTVNRKAWKELFKILHPKDYRKLFPKTFEFYTDLTEKKSLKSYESPYLEAKSYLDSGRYDEFVKNFGRLLGKAYNAEDGSDADLVSLLCLGKLEIKHLLSIMNYLQKNELGVSRYYEDVRKSNRTPYLKLIPTIKEFIFRGIGMKQKNPKLTGKKVWIDPDLKEYDFPENTRRESEKYLMTVDISRPEIKFTTKWDTRTIYDSTTKVYAWKGPGHDFRGGLGYVERGSVDLYTEVFEILRLKERGYKYLVFDNRTSYQGNIPTDALVSLKVGDVKVDFLSACRNKFGGLLDLETSDMWILNFDLTKLPTFNGNIQEAIVRYLDDSFRLSAYDWAENYLISCGASIVSEKSKSEIQYTKLNDKSVIY